MLLGTFANVQHLQSGFQLDSLVHDFLVEFGPNEPLHVVGLETFDGGLERGSSRRYASPDMPRVRDLVCAQVRVIRSLLVAVACGFPELLER